MSALQRSRQRPGGEKRDLGGQVRRSVSVRSERDGGNRILAPRNPDKLTGEDPPTTAQLQNGLPRQEVYHMTERVRLPEHAIVRDWVTVLQVTVAELLADRKDHDE